MRILAALLVFFVAMPALAHEFWIEPVDYVIEADGMVQGVLVNGENFEGSRLGYLPLRFDVFTMSSGMRRVDVENRIGSNPALDQAPLGEGLHVINYQSRLSRLTYTNWDKFLKFAAHKDFADIEAIHDARGLPRTDFVEGYWRFAKTLVGVGHSTGRDFNTGLPTEFVAQQNPYTDDLSDGMTVQLFYEGAIRADAQVEVFEKAPDDTVTVSLYRTDANGLATLPVKQGHSYLVDAVVLREPSASLAERAEIQWETLWASLTFAVPE